MPEPRADTAHALFGPTAADPAVAVSTIREASRRRAPLPTDVPSRPTPLPGIRAVLFDVYGTLFISGSGDVGTAMKQGSGAQFTAALEQAAGDTLARPPEKATSAPNRFGGESSPEGLRLGEVAREAYFAAISRFHASARKAGIDYPEVDIREVWQEVCLKLVDHGFLTRLPGRGRIETIALSYELLSNPIWPMPQARETLRALNEAGFPLGIVSNAQFFTPLLFEALLEVGPPELGFREELCAFSYRECRAKPSPEIFSGPLSALERSYGIDAAHTLYVGNDMKNDVLAASKTGLRTCLFAGDRRSLRLRTDDPEAAGIRPDAVVTTLGELPTVLSIGGGEHAQTSH